MLPPLPYTLKEASAVVMADGTICVGGEPEFHKGSNEFHVLRFCPRAWKWKALAPLPDDRARACITLASPDGVRLLALGGFVGYDECRERDERRARRRRRRPRGRGLAATQEHGLASLLAGSRSLKKRCCAYTLSRRRRTEKDVDLPTPART